MEQQLMLIKKNIKALWVLFAVALVVFLFSFSAITYKVDEGERGIKIRFGNVVGVGTAGLNFKLPMVDKIHYVSIQPQTIALPNIPTYSKDQQPAVVGVSVTFALNEKELPKFYADFKTINVLFERIIRPSVLQEFKVVFGRYSAASSIQERGQLIHDTVQALNQNLSRYPYIMINNVQIEDIDFSDAYEKTVEDRMKAEVEVQKVQQELQREKIQAEILVTQAKARADAIMLQAQAEAQALEIKGKALKDNPNLVELSRIEKWNGVMPQVQGQALPIVPLQPAEQ